MLLLLVVVHLAALHEVGSNNPDGIEIKKNKGRRWHSAGRDSRSSVLHGQGPCRRGRLSGAFCVGRVFCAGNERHVSRARELRAGQTRCKTRSTSRRSGTSRRSTRFCGPCPTNSLGDINGGARYATAVLCRGSTAAGSSRVRYRGWMYKLALECFVVSFISLGYLGTQPATATYTLWARVFSVLYFAFFF